MFVATGMLLLQYYVCPKEIVEKSEDGCREREEF